MGYLRIGVHGWVCLSRLSIPAGYARLYNEYGGAAFLDRYHLLAPDELGTVADRVGPVGQGLDELTVFATADGGAFFCWDADERLVYVPREATEAAEATVFDDPFHAWPQILLRAPFAPPGLITPFCVAAGALPGWATCQALCADGYPEAHTGLRAALSRAGYTPLRHDRHALYTCTTEVHLATGMLLFAQTFPPEIASRSGYDSTLRCQHAADADPAITWSLIEQAGWLLDDHRGSEKHM